MFPFSRVVLGIGLSTMLVFAACSSSESAQGWGSVVSPGNEREFRDPADDGFEGVGDEEFVALDPNKPTEVDFPMLSEPDDILEEVAEELSATAPDGQDGNKSDDNNQDDANNPVDMPGQDDQHHDDGNEERPANGEHEDGAILDTVEVIDGDPDPGQSIGFRDGNERNELGELVALDSAASLACADIEIALTALDEGNVLAAEENVRSAAERTGESGIAEVRSWAPELKTAAQDALVDLAPVLGFLNVCVEGGYEL